MIAFGSVLVLGILKGVMVAAVASLLLLLRRAARPHVAFLGRIPGTRSFSDLERHPDNEPVPGVLVVRVEAALLYFNVEHVRERIREGLRGDAGKITHVVIDLSSSPAVDLAGARLLSALQEELAQAGIALRVVEALAAVRDILRAAGLEGRVGHIDRKVTVADVVDGIRTGTSDGRT